MAILNYRGVEDANLFDSVEMFTGDPDNIYGVRRVRIRYDKRLRVRNRRRELDLGPLTEPRSALASFRTCAWVGAFALAVGEALWFWETRGLITGIAALALATLALGAVWLAREERDSDSPDELPRRYY